MTNPGGPSTESSGLFDFAKDGKYLDGRVAAAIEVSAPSAPLVAAALAVNARFPDGAIRRGTISARVKSGTGSIRFRRAPAGSVSFKGGVGFDGNVAVCSTANELLEDLDPDGKTLDGIDLPADGVSRYVALTWAYDIQGAAKGALALGAGTNIRFSADGQLDGFYAVIRAFPEDPPARDAVQSVIDNWMLPGQVVSPNQLAPGTWLVAEVDGEFAAKLSAQLGYRYNWLRNLSLAGLSGDIGLRIQAAAEAVIELGASDKFILVTARESLDPESRVVRVRLSRMARRGWECAVSAGAGVTGKTGRLQPGDLDDLIAAVFGLHGAQIVKDLQAFRGWADLSVPLPDCLAGFVVAYARNRLSEFAGDALARLAEARVRISEFLAQWSELTDQVCSLLWSELCRNDGKADAGFTSFLRSLAGLTGEEIRQAIEEYFRDPASFDSFAGRWMESALDDDLLAALADREKARCIGRTAASTLGMLDGGVLGELVCYVDRNLHIARVREIVDRASLESLDPWLKATLSRFLGEELRLDGLETVRKTLAFLDREARGIFDAAFSALNGTYSALFEAGYSSTRTRSALLDISFDFSREPDLACLLSRVIDGDWRTVLVESQRGVTLRKALLTHGIRRQSHVEINLPFATGSISHMASSLAGMTVVEDGGRVFVYEVRARDETQARHKWRSSLSVTGKIAEHAGGSVRLFAPPAQLENGLMFSYSFRMAFPSMRTLQLRQHLQPLASACFPRAFGDTGREDSMTVSAWVDSIERLAAGAEAARRGYLGDTLLSLRISLPGRVVSAWGEAPENALDFHYMEMSRSVQRALRRIIPLCYFQDPRRFVGAESGIAAQLLVYQALPVSTSISLNRGDAQLNTDEDLYWDYRSDAERRAMIFNDITGAALLLHMEQVRELLGETGDLREYARDYNPDNIDRIREVAFDPTGNDHLTRSLLVAESLAIRHAREAGRAMARYRDSAGADPAGALESMAQFGEKVTGAFHGGLSDLFRGQGPNIRELGSLLFLEAACALDPGLRAKPSANLEVTVLRSPVPASWRDEFLAGKRPAPASVAVRQSIVEKPRDGMSGKAS